MKTAVLAGLCLLFSSLAVLAQEPPQPQQFAAAGISYSPGATPAGTGLYARLMAGTGTYAFTVVDALPTTLRPFVVTTQFSTGVAQRIFTLGKVSIYVPTAAGVSYSGTNTGWAWTTGALATIPVKGNYHIMPNVRVVKSSVSQGTGYQLITGVLFGAGWN